MSRGQQQYVMVTKERRKSGCVGGCFHAVLGIFTFGMWPAMVWLAHLIGPKKKTGVTKVYGSAQAQPQPYPPAPYGYYPPPQLTAEQQQWEQWKQLPGQAPQQGYGPPPAAPYPQQQPYPPQQPPQQPPGGQWPQQPPAYPAPPAQQPPTQPYTIGQPPGAQPEPPEDPWDTGQMRRRG